MTNPDAAKLARQTDREAGRQPAVFNLDISDGEHRVAVSQGCSVSVKGKDSVMFNRRMIKRRAGEPDEHRCLLVAKLGDVRVYVRNVHTPGESGEVNILVTREDLYP